MSSLVWLFRSPIPTEVESKLTDVCKEVTEGIEDEIVTELDAADIPGIVCI